MMPDFIADIFSFLVYLTFFMLFVLLFSVTFKGCDEYDPAAETLTSRWGGALVPQMDLLNYMRTEVELEGEASKVSELIAVACETRDFDRIRGPLDSILSGEYNTGDYTSFEIDCRPGSQKKLNNPKITKQSGTYGESQAAEVLVPLYPSLDSASAASSGLGNQAESDEPMFARVYLNRRVQQVNNPYGATH